MPSMIPFPFRSLILRSLSLSLYQLLQEEELSPGLDWFDYAIIRTLPLELRTILLNIFNDLFNQDFFLDSWRDSLLILVSKADGKGVRSIALLSCFLKIFEKMASIAESNPDGRNLVHSSRIPIRFQELSFLHRQSGYPHFSYSVRLS